MQEIGRTVVAAGSIGLLALIILSAPSETVLSNIVIGLVSFIGGYGVGKK